MGIERGSRTDDALVAAARDGDGAALDLLLRRHYDRIYAVCRRLTGNEADALDAAQEALVAMARGIRRFDGRSSFSTWAYRVSTNASLDELRRRRRRPEPGLPADIESRDGSHPVEADHGDALADTMAVDEALAALRPEFRAPVVLRDLCDLDYAEIGAVLDLPPGTVRSRIARGRAQLARLLPHPGNHAPDIGRPSDDGPPTSIGAP